MAGRSEGAIAGGCDGLTEAILPVAEIAATRRLDWRIALENIGEMVMEWEDGSSAGSKKVLRVREESANLGGCPNPKKAATQPSSKSPTPQRKRIELAGYVGFLWRRLFLVDRIPEKLGVLQSTMAIGRLYTGADIHQPLLPASRDNSTAITDLTTGLRGKSGVLQ
jgi:hypothetical protein